MHDPLAYHVIFCTYGFWLPNDPRGSWSREVRAENLRPFGQPVRLTEVRSVARAPHDGTARRQAKQALTYPEVVFDGHQALSVANGFAAMVAKSGYVIHACSILPCHVHLVIRRHCYAIRQVVRLLRQAATLQLLDDGRHPFAALRGPKGRLPSVWAQDSWDRRLYTEEAILEAIAYVEDNPVKEGKRKQAWPFVIPFTGR